MGEYARIKGGGRVKIGTCEDLLYLRFDQLDLLRDGPRPAGDSDPRQALDVYRFRFPWPDEDFVQPGMFDDPFRSVGIYGVTVPDGVEHGTCQFTSNHPRGYVVSLPCPEAGGLVDPPEGSVLKVHRNGHPGPVQLTGQAVRHGRLVAICKCGGCGRTYNVPTIEDAEPMLVSLRSRADREREEWERARNRDPELPERCHAAEWWTAVADRIAAGYSLTFPVPADA